MNYIIEVKDELRYATCGDYFPISNDITKIEIKTQLNEDYQFLILIHELVEEHLTRRRGIKEELITKFDLLWEKGPKIEDEPGNCKELDGEINPYYTEHRFSENIERLIAAELGIDWFKYNDDLIC